MKRARRLLPLLAVAGALLGATPAAGAPAFTPVDPSPFTLTPYAWGGGTARAISILRHRMGRVTVHRVVEHLNRGATPLGSAPVAGVTGGFQWDARDTVDPNWMPQGIAAYLTLRGTSRQEPSRLLLVSWYSTGPHGTRISFARVGASGVRYRHVLLVAPTLQGSRQASFEPIPFHAGGIAVSGRYLYVADTWLGLRVFDLRSILRVRGRDQGQIGRGAHGRYNAYGYAYALPQVGVYTQPTPAARYSFVSTDRSTTPPSLVTGEYRDGKSGGHLYRWRLDPRSGRVVPGAAWEAYSSPVTNMQGVLALGGRFFVSASHGQKPGALTYGAANAKLQSLPWPTAPETLAYFPSDNSLWSLTERPGSRQVFSIALP